jgi:hypothetical protein
MTGCEIGKEGAERIGEMLEKNTSLKTLKLGCEIPHIHSVWSDALLVAGVH